MTIANAVAELERLAQAAAGPEVVKLSAYGRASIGLRPSFIVYRSGSTRLRDGNDPSRIIHQVTVEFNSPDAADFVLNDAIATVADQSDRFLVSIGSSVGGMKVYWVNPIQTDFDIEETEDGTTINATITMSLVQEYPNY